jgi:hypothetical protein
MLNIPLCISQFKTFFLLDETGINKKVVKSCTFSFEESYFKKLYVVLTLQHCGKNLSGSHRHAH